MSKTLKISIIIAILVLLAPKLVLFLASMSLFLIAIPTVTALVYFCPTLWKIWKVHHAIKNSTINSNYSSTKTHSKSSKTGDYIDLSDDDYSVVDDRDK